MSFTTAGCVPGMLAVLRFSRVVIVPGVLSPTHIVPGMFAVRRFNRMMVVAGVFSTGHFVPGVLTAHLFRIVMGMTGMFDLMGFFLRLMLFLLRRSRIVSVVIVHFLIHRRLRSPNR